MIAKRTDCKVHLKEQRRICVTLILMRTLASIRASAKTASDRPRRRLGLVEVLTRSFPLSLLGTARFPLLAFRGRTRTRTSDTLLFLLLGRGVSSVGAKPEAWSPAEGDDS